jgi:hypothetical protein
MSWLSARWGEDRRSLSTLEEMHIASCSEGGHLFSSTSQQALVEELAQVRRALQLVVLLSTFKENGVEEERMMQFVIHMLEWILPKIGPRDPSDDTGRLNGDELSFANALELGEILCSLPVSALRHVGVENTAPLLRAMIEVGALRVPLAKASKGLSLVDKAMLLRFSFLL